MHCRRDVGVAHGPSADSLSDAGDSPTETRDADGRSRVSESLPRAYMCPRLQRAGPDGVARAPTGVEWGVPSKAEWDRARTADVDEPVLRVGGWYDVPTRPRRRLHVSEYPVDHDALLYDRRLQTVYHLNATGFCVWRHCDGRPIEEIARSLSDDFDVDHETAIQHVREVVELLSIGELLTEDAADSPCD